MKIKKMPTRKANLKNGGDLSIYFIGTGAAFTNNLNDNNVLVVKGDEHLLIDCGTKCVRALHHSEIEATSIRNFLITHSHADHIGGLEEIMMKGRYVSKRKPSMIITEEYQKILWEQSLSGGSKHAETKKLTFEDFWDVVRPKKLKNYPRDTWETNLGTLNIKMLRTMHIPGGSTSWKDSVWSCGIVLDDKVMFTSDTKFDPDLLQSFDDLLDLDYIFHDCQLFTAGVHASLDELCTLPTKLKSKIVLMHYGDNWSDFKQQAEDAGFHSWAEENHTYIFT